MYHSLTSFPSSGSNKKRKQKQRTSIDVPNIFLEVELSNNENDDDSSLPLLKKHRGGNYDLTKKDLLKTSKGKDRLNLLIGLADEAKSVSNSELTESARQFKLKTLDPI
jgi:hypothetical protein